MNSIAASIVYNQFLSKFAFSEKITNDHKERLKLKLNFDTEEAFHIFYGIMEHLELNQMFQNNLIDLVSRIERFSETLKLQEPQIFRKLTKHGV